MLLLLLICSPWLFYLTWVGFWPQVLKVFFFFIACVFIYVATCKRSHVAAHLIDLTFPTLHRTAPSLCVWHMPSTPPTSCVSSWTWWTVRWPPAAAAQIRLKSPSVHCENKRLDYSACRWVCQRIQAWWDFDLIHEATFLSKPSNSSLP